MSDDAETRFELAKAIKAREAAEATVQAQAQQIAQLREALEECLTFEAVAAEHEGLTGCTCINQSRNTERLYETGRCPHQLARAALAVLPVSSAARREDGR